MGTRTRIAVHARPGSRTDSVAWDPWRRSWQVRCRAPPAAGEANAAILRLLAEWLGVPNESVRWVRAGAGADKVAEVDGLGPRDVDARLGRAAERSPRS